MTEVTAANEPSFAQAVVWGKEHFDFMQHLRANDPVHWSERDKLWLITTFNDVAAVSKNQAVFTSGKGVRPDLPAKIGMIDDTGLRHRQLRSLMSKGFTPKQIKKWEEKFQTIARETIDNVAHKGACDFAQDLAVPMPLLIIAEMIGIRREDREKFHRWSDALIATDGQILNAEVITATLMAFTEFSAYLSEIIEERRREPKDDLISILISAKDQGTLGTFDESEIPKSPYPNEMRPAEARDQLIMLMVLLLVAGNETTRNGLSGGMQLLLDNPDQMQKIVKDPSLIPNAVEEILRLVSPVQTFMRTVTQDTELHGKQLHEGDRVLLLYPSANRDETVFPDAETFDVTRKIDQHLAFGLGEHFCLGANLARMEMREAFTEVTRRLRDIRYAEGVTGPEIGPSSLVRSITHLPIRFTPEA